MEFKMPNVQIGAQSVLAQSGCHHLLHRSMQQLPAWMSGPLSCPSPVPLLIFWYTDLISIVSSLKPFSVFSLSLNSFSSVQSLIRVRLFATPWTPAHQASLSIINSQSLLILMSIELVMPSNHLILCCTLLLLPSIFPIIGVFSNESVLHIRWPKYWSFSFSISPSNEYPALISFRMDWFDLLAVQGTLKSLESPLELKGTWKFLKGLKQTRHSHSWLGPFSTWLPAGWRPFSLSLHL